MKKLIVAAAVGLTAIGAMAQGQFNFNNRVPAAVPPIDAKVFDSNGTTPLDGTAWFAQTYIGTDANSLSPAGSAVNFRTGAGAGYIIGGGLVTTSFAGGTQIWVEMRAWEAAKGTTYEAAVAAGGKFGKSQAIQLTVAVAPNTPPDMQGLKSFSVVPEPSVMALGVLGAAALLLRRRS